MTLPYAMRVESGGKMESDRGWLGIEADRREATMK